MKKIKINWGNGLALGMGAFMIFIIVMGICMFNQTTDEYDNQYYEKGLAFDSVYNQEKQVVIDRAQPMIKVERTTLHINFTTRVNGSIRFERLADPSLNRMVKFWSDTGNTINIPLSQFRTGRWDLSLRWVNNGKKYLYQKEIRVQ